MDSRSKYLRSVFDYQISNEYDCPVYQGRMQNCLEYIVFQGQQHYVAGLGYVL